MNEHINPQTMAVEPVRQARAVSAVTKTVQVAVVVAEVLLVALLLTGYDWQIVLAGHIGIIGVLIALVLGFEYAKVPTGTLQAFTLLTFAGGPVGAAAALSGEQQIWQTRGDALDRWYETIAPSQAEAVTLVDLIIDGRLVRKQSQLPRPFDTLLETGTVQEKQALLAYLAIEDDEKFVEIALALALRSPDQRVRVQAAAVAAHIKARNRVRGLPASTLLDGTARA
ncbi:hypothetical protein [Devosia rhizoryzae]|uniref:HEAT repeat domain-containing protein n=1 Tax=Devosia rhizoryzae TaxID=2774137 RepID=A0ABX7CCC3_9HYPH|nr:hypothetical protein [Devosia rhizoryzae]QQR40407.1 hypothetical protein JI748_05220 [Devosia rhizoryzae]